MKIKIKNVFKNLLAYFLLMFPFLAFAQNPVSQGLSPVSSLFPNSGGIAGSHDLTSLIVNVIQILLLFAGGIAVVFVIIGGFWYITSAGNEESAEKGRKTLTNAIIGVIIIVLSYTIITVISNLVASPNGAGF